MKDVFNPLFWEKRIKSAPQLSYSVAAIDPRYLEVITKSHEKIIKRFCVGRVLDFGCGYGRLAGYFDVKFYVGIDIVPAFIEIARKEHLDKKFLVGDIRRLPFKRNSFDWGVGVSMREMIRGNTDKWEKCQKELLRVCKKLLILEYEPDTYEIIENKKV